MKQFILRQIGRIGTDEAVSRILLDREFIPALEGLEGFGYVQVLWWFDGCDSPEDRAVLSQDAPYRRGPARLGCFATRSPRRPNPIALSCARVLRLDRENGAVDLDYLDAWDGSPVLDLKPYTPSLDRVERPEVPEWCAHWPGDRESSGEFDWQAQFNF